MKTVLPILKSLYDSHWLVARTLRRTVNISLLPHGMMLSFVCEEWEKGTGGEGVFLWPGFWRTNGFFSTQLHGWLPLAWFLQYGQLFYPAPSAPAASSNTHCLQHGHLLKCHAVAAGAASPAHAFPNMQLFYGLASAVWMVSPLPSSCGFSSVWLSWPPASSIHGSYNMLVSSTQWPATSPRILSVTSEWNATSKTPLLEWLLLALSRESLQ